MCEDGSRVSKALRYIHEVKYMGADPKPLIDKLFTYHNKIMLIHRRVIGATKTNIPGLYMSIALCEECEVPWPCLEIDSWLDTLNA